MHLHKLSSSQKSSFDADNKSCTTYLIRQLMYLTLIHWQYVYHLETSEEFEHPVPNSTRHTIRPFLHRNIQPANPVLFSTTIIWQTILKAWPLCCLLFRLPGTPDVRAVLPFACQIWLTSSIVSMASIIFFDHCESSLFQYKEHCQCSRPKVTMFDQEVCLLHALPNHK